MFAVQLFRKFKRSQNTQIRALTGVELLRAALKQGLISVFFYGSVLEFVWLRDVVLSNGSSNFNPLNNELRTELGS